MAKQKYPFVATKNIHMRGDKWILWSETDIKMQQAMARQQARAARGEDTLSTEDATLIKECAGLLAMLSA